MIEYVGSRTILAAQLDYAGFKAEPDKWWCCDGEEWTLQEEGATRWRYCAARHPTYRADTLEEWLMTKPLFSKRAATIQIAYRAVRVGEALDPVSDASVRQDEKWIGHYFVRAFNGSGSEIGQGEALTRSDALAEVILEILDYPPGRHDRAVAVD
jgi:hypothetical protein